MQFFARVPRSDGPSPTLGAQNLADGVYPMEAYRRHTALLAMEETPDAAFGERSTIPRSLLAVLSPPTTEGAKWR